jgi:hypothetical protein
MMTQGWRNYLWNSIRYLDTYKVLSPVEKGFCTGGSVYKPGSSGSSGSYKLNYLDFKSGFNGIAKVTAKADRSGYSAPDKMLDLDKKDPTGKKYSSLFQLRYQEFGEKAFTATGYSTEGKVYNQILSAGYFCGFFMVCINYVHEEYRLFYLILLPVFWQP